MTEAEVLELVALYGANAITSFTAYISVMFAFMITTFYVGLQLTNFQALAVSGLFVFSTGSSLLAEVGYLQAMFIVKESTPTVLDGVLIYDGKFWVPYMASILLVGILVGLYFMWRVRHPKTE